MAACGVSSTTVALPIEQSCNSALNAVCTCFYVVCMLQRLVSEDEAIVSQRQQAAEQMQQEAQRDLDQVNLTHNMQ
jgi:hypothetical protein